MQIYKKAYLQLFNRVSDALDALRYNDIEKAAKTLIFAQLEAEETIISAEDWKSVRRQMIGR